MELAEVLRTTGAVRGFTAEPVDDQVLYRILDLARFAPSGGNRQGVHVIVVRDQATREQLARLTEPAARRYTAQIEAGEYPWSTIIATSVSPQQIESTEPMAQLIRPVLTAAALLVVSVDLTVVAATDSGLDRVGVVAGGSVFPLAWNILLAARQEGLGGTLTTMAVACEPQVQALLGLPAEHAVACVIPIGHPVKQVSRLRRQPVQDFVTMEQFDGPALLGG